MPAINSNILVVAPHADDETLGCGGTILKHVAQGDDVTWLLATNMSISSGFNEKQIKDREEVIQQVASRFKVSRTIDLGLPPAKLDTFSKSELIQLFSEKIKILQPDVVYVPFRNDAHSDHECVFDAVLASIKPFRCPSVCRVLAYETISETDYGFKPEDTGFKPNVYMDISQYLQQKLEILELYEEEIDEFPFPRSIKAVEALARVRGSQCNREAAEAFMLIREMT